MRLTPPSSFILVLLLLLPHATLARQAADQTQAPWTGVKLVPPGDELVVKLKDGRTLNGRLVSAYDTGLVISRGDKTTSLDQAIVQKVYRKVPKSGLTRTQIGTLTGLGAGAALGAALALNDDFEVGWAVTIYALIGAGIGALIGSVSGGRRVKVLIYEAK